MEYNKRIVDMTPGDAVEGFYLLKSAAIKTSTSGSMYLNAVLSDVSGAIETKVWNYPGPIGAADEGRVVKIRGTVQAFRGTSQLSVERIRLAQESDPYELSEIVPVAPMDAEEMLSSVETMVASLQDDDYRAICTEMLARHMDSFRSIPAAKSVHHSFLNGLLMHTGNMMKIADQLAELYADTVDRDLLLAGALLHDFAKEEEFSFSELGLVTEYSTKGKLLGHLAMGAQEIAEVAKELHIPEEKSVLLQHLILSHHGEPEFGAVVRPQCAESELLSLIDLIDSRMEIYRETLASVPEGKFSQRVFALDKTIYHH
ncbi:MAG: HD domain-containing protein [Oscillospiraceae bacterium]|nr:HD domain-containing protein [Oscillospiraceae bacterium]